MRSDRRDSPLLSVSTAVRIAAVYVASRLITTTYLLLASALSPPGSRFGPGAGLVTYIHAWDAQWYRRISVEGYPSQLPLTDAGEVAHNAWAFMPLFPWLSTIVGAPLGSWGAGAVVIAVVSGYLCCLVLYRMLVGAIGHSASMWSVVLFASAPLAAMFQVAYPETLFLLLTMFGIFCLQRRRYGWLYAVILGMSFLRPGVLALALLLGLFGMWRWTSRRSEPLRRWEAGHIVSAATLATVLGLSWPVIVATVTGQGDAYLQTELSWRRLWMGDEGGFVPFEGWFQAAYYWFETWSLNPAWGPVAVFAVAIAVACILLFVPQVRMLGVEIRLWAASYVLYLLAVFLPQSSLFRLLLPLSPLWGAVAQPRSLAWRIGVLTACLIGQGWWIWNVYGLGNEFWHIP